MKISLVIPVYNEEAILKDTIRELTAYMQAQFQDYEILMVNDGSADRSGEMILEAHREEPHVLYAGYDNNRGKGGAVRYGVMQATGDIVIYTDCDLAYGTEVIGRAAEHFREHSETSILIGSRRLHPEGYEGYTALRRLASKTYVTVLALAAGIKLSDSQCGFKAFRTDVAKDIFSECETNGWAFDFEVLMRANQKKYKIEEMPVKIVNHRDSKIHIIQDSLRMLRDIRKIKKRLK